MAEGTDSDPYQGLIPVKIVRGDLISSEFLLDQYTNKAEEIINNSGEIKGIDRDYIKHLTYQEHVLSEHLYEALLADNPNRNIHKKPTKKVEELIFGPSLYYSAEDTTKLYSLDYHLKTYIDLEINKHFGISLLEYVNLSVYELNMVNKVVRDYLEALRAYRDREERSISSKEKNVIKELNNN